MDRSIDSPPSVTEVTREAVGDVVEAVHDNFTAPIRRNPLQSCRRLHSCANRPLGHEPLDLTLGDCDFREHPAADRR